MARAVTRLPVAMLEGLGFIEALLKTYRDMLRRTCGSMKRRISHGQAMRSIFRCSINSDG